MEDLQTARDWLYAEYLVRKNRNTNYSLRKFASTLSCSPGSLCEIFSGKRSFTKEFAQRVTKKLKYSPRQSQQLFSLVELSRRSKPLSPNKAFLYRKVRNDKFQLIHQWYHFALLSLIETDNFQMDPNWIANRLGVEPQQVNSALVRLEQLGLIHRHENSITLGQQGTTTNHDLPSEAIRENHRQILKKTTQCLDSVGIRQRDLTSISLAIDPSKIPAAKRKIRRFRRSLARFLESGSRTEVYSLNVQLIPLTQIQNV